MLISIQEFIYFFIYFINCLFMQYVIKNKKNGGRTNENKPTREIIGEENRLHTSPEFIGEENRLHASPPHNVS